jgi:hypothetical protein
MCQIIYKGILIRLTADLPAETLQAGRKWMIYFIPEKKRITVDQEYCSQQGYFLQ